MVVTVLLTTLFVMLFVMAAILGGVDTRDGRDWRSEGRRDQPIGGRSG